MGLNLGIGVGIGKVRKGANSNQIRLSATHVAEADTALNNLDAGSLSGKTIVVPSGIPRSYYSSTNVTALEAAGNTVTVDSMLADTDEILEWYADNNIQYKTINLSDYDARTSASDADKAAIIANYNDLSVNDPVSLLLDSYAAESAFSLRSLRTAYSGALIKIRRSSDNATKDFYPDTNGRLSLSSEDGSGTILSSWIATDDGFIDTWYDPSGNSNNGVQAIAGYQPKIISAGSLIVNGGLAAIYQYDAALTIPSNTFVTMFVVAKIDTINLINYVLFDTAGSNGFFMGGTFGGVNGAGFYDGSVHSLSGEDTNTHLIYIHYDGTYMNIGVDGGSVTQFEVSNFAINTIGRLGASTSLYGKIQEAILFTDDQSANRTNIESDINAFYSIY